MQKIIKLVYQDNSIHSCYVYIGTPGHFRAVLTQESIPYKEGQLESAVCKYMQEIHKVVWEFNPEYWIIGYITEI